MNTRLKIALLALTFSSAAWAAPSPYAGNKGPDGSARFQCMPEVALLRLSTKPNFADGWSGCYGG